MDPHSCNSTSEDLHTCSEFSSFTDDCHFLNVISCDLEAISSIVILTGNYNIVTKHNDCVIPYKSIMCKIMFLAFSLFSLLQM